MSLEWRIKSILKDLGYQCELLLCVLTRGQSSNEPHIRYNVEGAISPDHVRPLCLFSSYDGENIVRESVYYYLRQLKMAGFDTVFISTSASISESDLEKLAGCCIRIISRENRGYDFYSWKVGLEAYPQYHEHSGLLLTNDSVYGPLFDFGDIITRLKNCDADIVGMTDSFRYYPHLQSYFIYCKRPVVLSKEFVNFFDHVKAIRLKSAVIRKYEVGFARILGKQFRLAALYPLEDMPDQTSYLERPKSEIDPTFRFWKPLITKFKFPFLKRSLLTRRGVSNYEVASVLAQSGSDFDVNMLTGLVAELDAVITPYTRQEVPPLAGPRLSICIGTYNRAKFIGETLDSMVVQLEPGVEIVIMDNASSDNTTEVVTQYQLRHPEIRYFRKQENTGFDRNYDEAVKFAKGEYCWLMSDDDLLSTGAIANVLSVLGGGNDLIVVNSEVRNADLSVELENKLMKLDSDQLYREEDRDNFFIRNAKYLSFVGCLVIRRTYWLSKNASSYYGTGFVHVGVVFQSPSVVNVRVMAKPSVIIRLGNSTWNAARFETWMIWWPNLIWSFTEFPDAVKRKVCPREPWRRLGVLLKHRAMGVYTKTEFNRVWSTDTAGVTRSTSYIVSIFPESWANFLVILYLSLMGENKARVLYDLLQSPHAGVLSHFLARILGKKSTVRSLRQ
ncbi:MAG: glycosyltransferase [Nitrosomonadaceae bacterium]|nr:glycosyltransferase [Nitrosospira sp.]MDW7598378.1 glycosyltransferase [Nitrosomonadaceae bacterium]MBI0409677.1 glycosyltransferase [Nitrosospira sp.]MBI0409771.1 glycosyltransferase [Nitrosospira sp.]MDW7618384.1 glycosyltransferase [Nitrosomonadaceae bacterium]